jgi:pyrimidine-nucleoside phosphorylase
MTKKKIVSKKAIKPSFVSLIEKKRDGGEFTEDEIRCIVDAIHDGEMLESQMAALAMTIFFKGMSAQETATFADEVMLTGETLDLSKISRPKIEQYSTGGVGDKVGLVLPALASACGVIMPTMIGDDEDMVLGQIEKLESIPGFSGHMDLKTMGQHVKKNGCVFARQIAEISPVGQKIHALRAQTGTMPCLQLITSSVLSKKWAQGAEGLVVDVKWGNGALIKDVEQAKQLARSITRVARTMKRRCVALVTDMNQPLGDSVGTALEVQEAIRLLKGEGREDLQELLLKIGMEVVRLAGVAGSTLSAKQTILKHIKDGSALQKFKDMVAAQGGDVSYLDDPSQFPVAKHIRKLPAAKRGYVHTIDAGMIAQGIRVLSMGKDGKIDHSTGLSELKKVGDQVKQGEPLMMIHYNDESRVEEALQFLRDAYRLAPKRPSMDPLVIERIA